MAKRKSKGNPKRVKAKTVDEQTKMRLKISGPKNPMKSTIDNTWSYRRTRSRSVQEVESCSMLQSNEQGGQASLFSDKLIEEQNYDLGEFARAIGRFHQEAQLQSSNRFDSREGEVDSVIHGDDSHSQRDDIHTSPDYVHADANGVVAAGVGAGVDDAVDANAVAEAEVNGTEGFIMDPEQPVTQDDHVKIIDNGGKHEDWDLTTLTNLTKITKSSLKKVVVYNEHGQPIGPVAVELANYMGSLARYLVPITHKNWKEVPNTLIDKLWNYLEQRFVLDPRSRKILISGIGDRWRCFKSDLTTKHVLPFKDEVDLLAHPPRKYGFIKQEHWDEFVKSRLSNAFQALHETQSKIRSKSLYPARMGRRGYAHLAEELKKSGVAPDEIDRSLLWKKARQNKKGEYANDAIKEKAMIIDKLKNERKGVPMVNDEKSDILTLALGPEKPGRVRGIGQFVTPTTFFHTPRCGTSVCSVKLAEEPEMIESKLQEEKMSRLKVEDILHASQEKEVQLEEQLAQLINQGILPTPNSENVCANTNETTDSEYGKSMDEGTSLPYPEFRRGKDAVDNSPFQTFYTRASRKLTNKLSSISIQVDDAVFGTELELFLDLDDIRYICQKEDLSANCFMVYMRHLYNILTSKQTQGICAFLYPTYVSSESGEHFSDAITERMQTTECQWIFVPFNPEGHWILVVINIQTMSCYWMDPLGLPDQHNIKPLINVGLKALQVDGKRRSNPIWKTIKCPKQSVNNECGLYVLRYMRELINGMPNPLVKKEPFAKLSYSQDELDAVRLEWIHSIEKYL